MASWRRQSAANAASPPPRPKRPVRRWASAFACSLLANALVVGWGLPRLLVATAPTIEVVYLPDVSDKPDLLDDAPEPENQPPPEPLLEPDRRLAKLQPEKPPEPEKKKEKKPLDVVPMPDLPMVDQEQFPDETDNDKAHYLAQKNHKAAEDTQAKDRTLEKPPAAEPNAVPDQPPIPPPPASTPTPELAQTEPAHLQQPNAAESPLRMRELEGMDLHERAEVGDVQMSRVGDKKGSDRTLPIAPQKLGPVDYDRLVGPGVAESERRAAAVAQRTTPGYWDRMIVKQDALRKALENFTPNVRIGNQSELGTRKHPFAAFITSMHRQIHHYWGDGFLADLDRKSQDTYPMTLVTALEIGISQDGKVHSLFISRHSGSLPFDTAAIDAVSSAAPFQAPPDTIKSRDGNVYLTWYFHRDDRQCHPTYTEMHILTTPGPPEKKAPPALLPKTLANGPGQNNELNRSRFASSLPLIPVVGGSQGSVTPRSSGTSPSSSSSSSGSSSAASSASAPSPGAAEAENHPPKSSSKVPEAAREATERWLSAYQRGDARWLAGASGLPFTAGGKQVADSSSELRTFYQEMISEGTVRRERVSYYTPTQFKAKRGKLPRGGDDDDMMFAWIELAGEDLILLLSPTDRGWSVVGIDR